MSRLLVVLALSVFATDAAQAEATPVSIGVLAFRGEQETLARWSPLAEYLNDQIAGHRFVIEPYSLDALRAAVADHRLQFVLTNPGHYVELQTAHGVSRLVTLKNLRQGQPYTVFGAVIFTRADRNDIRRLTDLRGKSFMAVSRDAFGGFQFAWRELKANGIDPFRDLSRLVFNEFPQDDIVYAVRDGIVDAGTVRTDGLEKMAQEGKIDIKEFRILNPRTTPGFPFSHSTRLYPEWPLAAARDTPETLARHVAVALLTMPVDHPAAATGGYAGWTVPLDYQPVHDLFRELGIGPYRQVGTPSLRALVIAYGHWLLLGLVLLLILAVTTVYVLGLNRRLKQSARALEQEISERRHVQDEMRKLSRALEQTADSVIITDRDGIIEYVNPAFEWTTGYRRQEAVGHTPRLVKSGYHDADFYERLWKTIVEGQAFHAVVINRRKDGSFYYEEKTITPLKDAEGRIVHFVSTGKDVTERHLAEEHARQHQAQLAHVSRVSTMGEMASALAHEINQPLAAITNYAQGCVRRLRDGAIDRDELLRALERIRAQGERSAAIVRRLRGFVHKGEPRRKHADINRIVREAVELANVEARRSVVALRFTLSENLSPVLVDTIQIEQVVLNLVRNAIEAINSAKSTRRLVSIETGNGSVNEIRVAVHDTGPGLPTTDIDQLFEAFYTTKPEGMGMGLSISRSIIEWHGGRIRAHPNTAGGASFLFTLPSAAREGSV